MGPKFHQTGMGVIFFEMQVPELIKALNRVADEVCQLRSEMNKKRVGEYDPPLTQGQIDEWAKFVDSEDVRKDDPAWRSPDDE